MFILSDAKLAVLAASLVSLATSTPLQNKGTVTIPLSKRKSESVDIKALVARDLARVAHFNGHDVAKEDAKAGAHARASSASITNGDESYYAEVSFCGTKYSLIVDTGSSNTWAGSGSSSPTNCGTANGGEVYVPYGSGYFYGDERTGSVSFAGLTVKSQSFGAASYAVGFDNADGILGVGPVVLTEGTVQNLDSVPTFLDNLHSQGSIQSEVLGVYFHAESGGDASDANGELTIGGTDSSKYTGSITYVPKSTSGAVRNYWAVAVSGISYGSTSLLGSSEAVVDTGTTLLIIPSSAYTEWLSVSKGTTNAGLAHWTTKPTSNLTFKIGGTTLELTPAQYLVPSAQTGNFQLGGSGYWAFVANGGTGSSEDPVNFVLGQKFLENYYSVYDTTNSRVGFAKAK